MSRVDTILGRGLVELVCPIGSSFRARRRLAPLVRRRRGRALLEVLGLGRRVIGLGEWLELIHGGRTSRRGPVYSHRFTPAPPAGPRRRP